MAEIISKTTLKAFIVLYPVQFGEGALPVMPANKQALYVVVLVDGAGTAPMTGTQMREAFPSNQYRISRSGYYLNGKLFEPGGAGYAELTADLTRSTQLLSGALPAVAAPLPEAALLPEAAPTTVLGAPSVTFQTPVSSVARWMLATYVFALVSFWLISLSAGLQ
jgi:hypothetical protein